MIIKYEEIFEENITNYNSINLKLLGQIIYENEELKKNILGDFKNLIRIAVKQKLANINSLNINFFNNYRAYWD